MNIFKKVLLTSSLFAFSSATFAGASESFIPKKIRNDSKSIFEKPLLIAENIEDNLASYVGFDTLKITVTGTRTERTVFEFPGSVTVFDSNELDSSGSSNWRDLFRNDAGLGSQDFIRSDYSRDYAKGDSGNINIRGLEGNRILTQVDGITIPRFSYGSSTYSVSRQNFIELSNLGKVEVLKGSGSALYGSDALGGVVSLRSLRPDDVLKEGEKRAVRVSGTYKSSNSSYKPNLKYAFRDGDTEGIISITHEAIKELNRKAPRIYINNQDGNNNSYFGRILKKINDNSEIGITLENNDKSNITTTNIYNTPKDSSRDLTDSKGAKAIIEYNYKSDIDRKIDNFKGSIYLSALDFENEWQYTGASSGNDSENQKSKLDQDTIGLNLQFTNNIAGEKFDQKLTLGFEGSVFEGDRIQNDYKVENGVETLDGTYRRNPKTDVTKLGLYVQDEISKGKWDIIAGLRFDTIKLDAHSSTEWYNSGSSYLTDQKGTVGEPADIDDSNISPNLSLLYRLNNNSNIYGKYSRGFRTPSWEEFNSSHINVYYMGPYAGWGAYTTKGNPNLKAETSNNYEIGYKTKGPKFDFSLAGFHKDFKNFLEQSVEDGTETLATSVGNLDATVYRTKNVADANISGLEASSTYYFSDKNSGLSFGNSIAYQVGDNETENEPLKTVNPFSIVSNLKYIFPNKKLVANLSNTYTGVPRVTTDYKKGTSYRSGASTIYNNDGYIPDAYFVTDLQLAYKVNNNFSTNLGIYNIFDTTYYKWSDLRSNGSDGSDDKYYQKYAQPGTSLVAGFSWRF